MPCAYPGGINASCWFRIYSSARGQRLRFSSASTHDMAMDEVTFSGRASWQWAPLLRRPPSSSPRYRDNDEEGYSLSWLQATTDEVCFPPLEPSDLCNAWGGCAPQQWGDSRHRGWTWPLSCSAEVRLCPGLAKAARERTGDELVSSPSTLPSSRS